jgi:4-hydroxy-3-methylbut-2-enyl diphosphate reductase IspH
VLRRANAEVVAARADEALKLLRERQFDLVVLCHTLTPEETNKLASLAHQRKNDAHVFDVLEISKLNWSQRGAASQPEILVARVIEILNLQVAGQSDECGKYVVHST